MSAPGDAAPPPVDESTTMDGHRPDDDDDQNESFIDEGAADYEEVADLDEDDEAPMSSDDEDDADEEGRGDDEMEDRDAAATATLSPDRDDAECVACEHAAPVYCVAWSCDRECATVVSGGGDDKGYFRRGSEPARELQDTRRAPRRRRFRRMVRRWRRVDWMDACSTAAMESCVTRWKGPAVGSSGGVAPERTRVSRRERRFHGVDVEWGRRSAHAGI